MDVGIDIETVDRFQLEKQDPFIQKVFHPTEIEYSFRHTQPHIHLAGMFCVKEALQKTIDKTIDFQEIIVKHTPNGKPFVEFNGYDSESFSVSISHSSSYAVAVVVKDGR